MKRSADDDSQQPVAKAAKSSRTDSGAEGFAAEATVAPKAAAEATAAQKAAAEATAAPKAAAAAKPGAAPARSIADNQRMILSHAEEKLNYWYNVVQREKMQLQAHVDGRRRNRELQLPEIRNQHGKVIGHYDPDPDIDRLHIKVWTADSDKYVCFLDCRFLDTIGTLKRKIQEHPEVEHITFSDMMVFYKGRLLSDELTLIQAEIDDDCILHAVNNDIVDVKTEAAKASEQFHQWRRLLSCVRPRAPIASAQPIAAANAGAASHAAAAT